MADSRDEMVDALLATSRVIVGIALRSLAASGADVTLAQYRALVVLAARGPLRVVDIAAELGVNPSTGTRMCERLVRKGFIDRQRIGADRREVQLTLTEEGGRVVAEVTANRRSELTRLVDTLPVDHLDPALAMLRELAAAAGEPTERDFWMAWHPGESDPSDAD
jgi:DNA-binding MarR family transcriptional regulator